MTACTTTRILALAAVSALVAGCSNSSPTLSTASVAPEKPTTTARVDPACAALASQIDGLRAEGSPERLEKAATGKSSTVQVKRSSLAKQAELNKAYADFQTRCGPPIPRAQTAAAPIAPTVASATSAQPAVTPAVTPAVAPTTAASPAN